MRETALREAEYRSCVKSTMRNRQLPGLLPMGGFPTFPDITLETWATPRGTRKPPGRRSDREQLCDLCKSLDPQRTEEADGDFKVLLDNHVNASLPSAAHIAMPSRK